MATDHQVQPIHGTRHFHIARGLRAMVAIFVVAHVGCGNHHVGLLAQLGHQFGCLGDGASELDVLHVVRVRHFLRVFGRQAHDRDAQAAQCENLVRRKHPFCAAVDVGRQHGKLRQVALHAQHKRRLVELMVAHRHRVVTQQVHAFEVRHGVLQVRLRHAGVHIAAVQQQAVAATCCHIGANGINHGLARRHAILAVRVFPETAMVVVGVHDRQAVSAVFLRPNRQGRRQRRRAGRKQGGGNRGQRDQSGISELPGFHGVP